MVQGSWVALKPYIQTTGHGFRLLLVEKVGFIYLLLTTVLIGILWPHLVEPFSQLAMRGLWLLMAGACLLLGRRWKNALTDFARTFIHMGWLSVWYPDVYEFNRFQPNLDHIFAQAEQSLFGCQPSLLLSQWLSSPVWSEAFNLGYWSYFPMILVLALGVFVKEVRAGRLALSEFQKVMALVLCSFFIYYAIFMFLPVAGPQFYFCAVGVPDILAGHFPSVGLYFSSPTEMLPPPGWSEGLFHHLVSGAQAAGERPVAAFPSSHVGISTILLMLAWKHARPVAWLLLPLWLLLVGATVYIQAHYVIDAIAGLLSAPIVLSLSYFLISARKTNQA